LQKSDFDGKVFTIHRGVSARKFVDSTKTGEIHQIPCHSDFRPFLEYELEKQKRHGIISPFLFVNPSGKLKGKPYSQGILGKLWYKALEDVGEEHIRPYAGTKHSSCSQFINEKEGNQFELQMITDHARLESVKRYAKTEISRRKELMERKVLFLDKSSLAE
jgi:integrase